MTMETICTKCEGEGKIIIVVLDLEANNGDGSQWGGDCSECGEHWSLPADIFTED